MNGIERDAGERVPRTRKIARQNKTERDAGERVPRTRKIARQNRYLEHDCDSKKRNHALELVMECPAWRTHYGLRARVRRAAAAAATAAKLRGGMTILLADDAHLKALNRDFRGKNRPTNVLSFPSTVTGYHGDVALAYGVCADEARKAGRAMADHACHLVVHGVLHLAGYDHVRDCDAEVMEPLEVKILNRLGIADPYRVLAP